MLNTIGEIVEKREIRTKEMEEMPKMLKTVEEKNEQLDLKLSNALFEVEFHKEKIIQLESRIEE